MLNNPINAIDPDGKRVFFIGGAGNDQDGWNYISRWGNAFTQGGIQGFTRVDASTGKMGDVMFTSGWRSDATQWQTGVMSSTPNQATWYEGRMEHKSMDMAVNQINSSLADKALGDGEQLNLAGYSFGSVVQAHAALKLADAGTYVDNVILIGSPISDNSKLYKALSSNTNIGQVLRFDIEKDKLSNADAIEFLQGAFQNSSDDGPHFDLARPGKQADTNIQGVIDWLRKNGVE